MTNTNETMIAAPRKRGRPRAEVSRDERLRIGAYIAAQLEPGALMSTSEVAKKLGISRQMVHNIECEALYKLRKAVLETIHESK